MLNSQSTNFEVQILGHLINNKIHMDPTEIKAMENS